MELIIHWQELPDEDVTYLCLLCSEWNANLDAAIYNINIQKFDDEAKDDARHNSSIMYRIIYTLDLWMPRAAMGTPLACGPLHLAYL